MTNPLTAKSWSPYVVGAGIGILSWIVFYTANTALGITTAFENTSALAAKAVAEGQVEGYLSAHAKKPPKIDWQWMLVVGVFVGAMISSWLSGDRNKISVPELWQRRFGPSVGVRWAVAFAAGTLMMLGARLAGGCTSGNAISGGLQLALSGWLFALTFFPIAIVTAMLLYGRQGEQRHV